MQALRVTTSNRLEALADRLAAVAARPLRSPLARETIVVRNPGMERWVTLALAKRLGIWANAYFPLPNVFLDGLFHDYLGESPAEAWKPEVLVWRIQRLLPELLDRGEFASLRAYLESESAAGLKRWQLAGRITDLLDQYLVYRPDWIEEWRRARPAGRPGPDRDWQMTLLRRLWDEGMGVDRAAVRLRFLEALRRGEPGGDAGGPLPERVSVFGIAALPPLHLEALAALAGHVEVNLFLLNPCRQFWFEQMSDRRFLRLQRAEAETARQKELWEPLPSSTGNGLLASLGGLGAEVFGMLLDVEPREEDEAFTEPGAGTLLARVQSAILDNEPPPEGGRARIERDDRSLQVHSCHGPMREIEVLRDRLLALFDADPTLLPEQVVVMAPEIETYVPYIEAVFRRGAEPPVPYNVSDRKLTRASSLANTFLSVLGLPRLRFAAPEVLDILESEPVREKLGLAEGDLGRIRQWVVESGIRWGIDAGDRARLGLPARIENTWRFGLRRLVLGTALEDDRVFAGVLPLAAGERETLSVFVDFVERLIAAVDALGEPRPLSAWSVTLQGLLAELFAEGPETRALAAEIARLAECGRQSGFEAPVPVEVIASVLSTRLDQASPGLGFLTEGVTFCSLLPMRSIPFRVICLLGMNFGAFPRADSPAGFDLMASDPRPGDRSRRNDDRYLFLETIVSARDVLYLSFVGRSPDDGSAMAPSVVVSELLDDLRRRFDLPHPLPLEHPLHAWSPRYFDGRDERLWSYSREALDGSREAVRAAGGVRGLFLSEPLPPAEIDADGIRLEDLVDFYRNPARFLLRHRLEIVLRDRAIEIESREPFEVDGLERYLMQNELLERWRLGEALADARPALRGRGSLPHGPAGELDLAGIEQAVDRFVGAHGEALRPRSIEAAKIDVEAGGARLAGTVDLWDGRLLRYRLASAKAFDRLGLWIRHLAAFRARAAGGPSVLLASDCVVRLPPAADTAPLDDLVRWYLEGLRLPLAFFSETSLAFAETVHAGGSEEEGMKKARQKWQPGEWDQGQGRRGRAVDPAVLRERRPARAAFPRARRGGLRADARERGEGVKSFDVESTPLIGVNLVEASAGTGKTWSLARLVVRLVVERRTEVSRILVVTFTEAATEELRVKVRGALIEALGEAGDGEGAAFLREAVSAFDQAAIHTIHAFCRRVLTDSAFESGALFDGELITDQAALLQEAADDFWRRAAEGFSPLYLAYLRSSGVGPDSLADLVARYGARLGMRVAPEPRAAAKLAKPAKLERAFEEALQRFREAWDAGAERFLLESPALARNRYQHRSMPALVDLARQIVAFGAGPALPGSFAKLTASQARAALKQDHARAPLPPAFERAEELAAAAGPLVQGYRARAAALRAEALSAAREGLRRRKAELGVSYFDDLLLDVHRALAGRGARALVASVRARYDAALVDEAQDTDPVQFEIFRKLFGSGRAPLFLIGDPKQAIYSFRGADVHAYLEARRGAENTFTLGTNWRSTAPLVRAVNAIFASRPRPFLVEDIDYLPVAAARDGAGELPGLSPVAIWLIRRIQGRRPSKEAAREQVAAALAGDIVRLLQGGRVTARDVAILVRTHRHAAEVQEHLRARGIPSVRNVSENLFASAEAEQLQRILAAVIEPGRGHVLHAAAATDLLGLDGGRIYALSDAEWEGWASRFADYADVWARRGFYPMFRLLMGREKVAVRLLSLADGELRLARLAQLAEKLHETAVRDRLGMEALLKWLADTRMHPPETEVASRMETDAEAVQIVTIHLAKGREWPVVYCPFLWDLPQHPEGDAALCHENGELVLDLGTAELDRRAEAARQESLAEELRLLYVALTRARERLVFAWGAASRAEKSALGYLLHPAPDGGVDSLEGVGDDEIRARLERLAREAKGAIAVEEIPAAGHGLLRRAAGSPDALSARGFAGTIDAAFRLTSFTALARLDGVGRTDGLARRDAGAGDDAADRDEEPGLAGLAGPARPAAASAREGTPEFIDFPRGARPGTFVHALLERLDFARAGDADEVVRQALREFGYGESWLPALAELGRRAAAIPVGRSRLSEAGEGGDGPRGSLHLPPQENFAAQPGRVPRGVRAAVLRGACPRVSPRVHGPGRRSSTAASGSWTGRATTSAPTPRTTAPRRSPP